MMNFYLRCLCVVFGGSLLQVPAYGQSFPAIHDDSYGHLLTNSPDLAVWWCEATYKVGQVRSVPTATNAVVEISAARHEYEPFQLVLRADAVLTNLSITVSDFVSTSPAGTNTISSTNVEVCLVEYVPVLEPTDEFGTPGPHPDPLIPLTNSFDLSAGTNQPLWVTVYVSKDTPAGDYEATLTLEAATPLATIPVSLHVYNFALPEVTHTRTAYYVDVHVDQTWHKLSTLSDRRFVWDLYMENYRKHRVSPYSAHLYAPLTWTLTNGQFTVNFTDFDEAMERYIDEFGFNSFNLFGHKSPTFPTSLGGHSAFTPQYRVLFTKLMTPILAHLREKGWLDNAYCYWIDEPSDASYPYMLDGLDTLLESAPDLRRLVTILRYPAPQYEESLNGRVDLWVPLVSLAEAPLFLDRRLAGEEYWWYPAAVPKYPHPNFFIDHPAINHRIRFWAARKYDITGDLYFAVNYWSGRNPWETTRTWTWTSANGDGVLLYPPTKTPPSGPLLKPPLNSLRWELTREALEDSEYFWLLGQLTTNGMQRFGPDSPVVVEGHAALDNALALVTNLTSYPHDPQPLYAARHRVAQAIEALDDGAPFIVRQPVSRAVESGGSVVLRAEALGWPMPTYQWQFNGTDIPGVNTASLTLSNFTLPQSGSYRVMASNSAGVATSAAAQVEGYGSDTPRIISQPQGMVRPVGEVAVFSVTAVSSNSISYSWFRNNLPVQEVPATNSTLLLTNLNLNQAGDYSVVLSNTAGIVNSTIAKLTLLTDSTNSTSTVSTGLAWRYHDLGVDLETAWRAPEYDDTSWAAGPTQLGFGDGDESTVLPFASVASNSPTTVYFRHTFQVSDSSDSLSLEGHLLRDDGAVVYLNGTEVFRNNLPTGEVTHATSALSQIDGLEESAFLSFSIAEELLLPGTNVVAVEIHQSTEGTNSTSGPVGYWSFDEPVSPWNDSAGTNHFLATGATIVGQPGTINGCVSNDAAGSDYLISSAAAELAYSGPFTVGGWFAWGAGANLPATCLEKQDEFRLYYSGTAINRYRFEVNGTSVQDQTSATAAGQWRFVVGWFDGTNAHIQVDDGPVYSAPTTTPTAKTNSLIALSIGSGGLAADEVFFYKRILSSNERAILYSAGDSSPTGTNDLSFDFELTGTWAQLPQFLSEAESLTRPVGASAAFYPTVVSASPMTYQWLHNGSPILSATNNLLFLENVAPAEEGEYRLAASNASGTATNSPSTLTVAGIPSLAGHWSEEESAFELAIPQHAVACTVLTSTNLVDWAELLSLPPSPSPTNFLDTITSNTPTRFYRLRLDL